MKWYHPLVVQIIREHDSLRLCYCHVYLNSIRNCRFILSETSPNSIIFFKFSSNYSCSGKVLTLYLPRLLLTLIWYDIFRFVWVRHARHYLCISGTVARACTPIKLVNDECQETGELQAVCACSNDLCNLATPTFTFIATVSMAIAGVLVTRVL